MIDIFKGLRLYKIQLFVAIILSAVVLSVVSGLVSPSGFMVRFGYLYSPQAASCTGINLGFTYYGAIKNVTALKNQTTVSQVYVTNTGNVTENTSISAIANSSLINVLAARSFLNQVNNTSYFQYNIVDPTVAGNYSLVLTLSSAYEGCVRSVSIPVAVQVK